MGSASGQSRRLGSSSVYTQDLYESWREGESNSNMSYQDIALLSAPRLIPPLCADCQLLLLSSSVVINFHIPEDSVM